MTPDQIKKRDESAKNYRKGHMRDDDIMTFADCRKSYVDGWNARDEFKKEREIKAVKALEASMCFCYEINSNRYHIYDVDKVRDLTCRRCEALDLYREKK